MPREIPTAVSTHIVANVTPAKLAGYLQAQLSIADAEVVHRQDGGAVMPFDAGGVVGGRLIVTRCPVGAKFTISGGRTGDQLQAVREATKVARIGMSAEQMARIDPELHSL